MFTAYIYGINLCLLSIYLYRAGVSQFVPIIKIVPDGHVITKSMIFH